jgi:hypothetical protein
MSIRGRRAALLAAVPVLGVLAFATAPAHAKQIRLFSGSFGAATSAPANPYPLSNGEYGPSSVAVDTASGDVYVTDQGNYRVEKFTRTGEFVLMFGKGVNRTAVEAAGSEAEQNVCTLASGDVCQAGTRGSSPGAFDPANIQTSGNEISYLFLTVDNSSGPSKGDVYVADSGDDLITKFDPTGKLVSAWGDNGAGGSPNGQLNGSAALSPVKGFFPVFEGVAVDSSGNLWAADFETEHVNGGVFEFRQDSSFVKDWNPDSSGVTISARRAGIALDSQDNVYALPQKYDSAGNLIGRILGERRVSGVAVDSGSNELYIAENEESVSPWMIGRYDASCKPVPGGPACSPVESFGAGHLPEIAEFGAGVGGLATDASSPADTVYAADLRGEVATFSIKTVPDVETRSASSFTTTSATLNGTVNPAGVELNAATEGCRFEWGETTEPYEHTAPCDKSAAQIGTGAAPVEVHAAVSGLLAGKTYHFRLVAANANDVNAVLDEPSRGADSSFGPPLLESSSVAAVSSTAATLQAQAQPNGVDTRLHFEYGTEAGVYGHSTAVADLGSAGAAQSVSQPIQGLAPLVTYHYRVVIENVFGTVTSEDHSFTTQGQAVSGLPDARAWELVSPPDKNGIALEAIPREGGVIQAAADGGGLAYIAKGPIDSEPAANRSPTESQLLARRGPGGWSTLDIATPHQAAVGVLVGHNSEYRVFSGDLSLGLVEPEGATPLSPLASERTPYLRRSSGEYVPLVYPGNVPEGVKFGGKEFHPESYVGSPEVVSATPDLSHVLLSSPSVLSSPSFTAAGHYSLYEWAAGAIGLVSEIPLAPATLCGGSAPACVPAAVKGFDPPRQNGVGHKISDDGNRVFFETNSSASNGLYLRDVARGETIQLDVPNAGAQGGRGRPVFQDASVDGARVFFTDGAKLTADSKAEGNNPDLYMCEIGETASHLACTLKDLTVDSNPGESGGVLGGVIGASSDGSAVYFVANGALTGAQGAVHGNCIGASTPSNLSAAASCNLYRYDTATGETRLIAILSNRDVGDWAEWSDHRTARVSPDGRWLAFMSQRPLTGYDNRDANPGAYEEEEVGGKFVPVLLNGRPAPAHDEEVFLYDASAEEGQGRLVCASCNPTGARPAGVFDKGVDPNMLVDRPKSWASIWLAASIPGWTPFLAGESFHQSRYLSDSGRLFFNSADALVPQDSNATQDVYQYEPPGVGGCTEASASFGRASAGCVDLISSAGSSEESVFLDASESGNDVFFLTASQLAPTDVDKALDVYDAHVCSAESPCPAPPPAPEPECAGDACQGFVQAPNDPTPGSLTFSGPGNLVSALTAPPVKKPTVRCKKPKKLSHRRCVKPKRKAKKAKRATTNRRAGR